MTQHEMTVIARGRLSHWWELHGPSVNPRNEIRRIVSTVAPRQRREFIEELQEYWLGLCAQEGDD